MKPDEMKPNMTLLTMVKDIVLGLIQIGGLLLTINLAIISATTQMNLIGIRMHIIVSSLLLVLSIFLGFIVLSMILMIIDSTLKRENLENLAQIISNGQALSFLFGMVFMVWAVIIRSM